MRRGALALICWLATAALGAAAWQPSARAQTPEPADTNAKPWAPAEKPQNGASVTTTKAPDAPGEKPSTDEIAISPPPPPPIDPKVLKANAWTIGLASGLPEGTFMRFGAEIARNLNDGDRLRVMPLLTNGATQNITDLMYLHGV
ncbi:MAG TPA: hypothetical protein VFZ16_21735, partial [Hyphomicrobiaceae bacterium]|nr:hypothetical protein [Hyphomicrobiaceae bacterium]